MAKRLSNRVQITADRHRPYLDAIDTATGREVYDLRCSDFGAGDRTYAAHFPLSNKLVKPFLTI